MKLRDLKAQIGAAMRDNGAQAILEIGGGHSSHIAVAGARYIVIDPDETSADLNRYAAETITADAQGYHYGSRRFDAIICWNVLEHISHPQLALYPALLCLNEGGWVVIAGPLPTSLKGLLTKYTPHWFHVLTYRYLYGVKTAGQPGHAPFPTIHAANSNPDVLLSLLADYGCEANPLHLYTAWEMRRFHRDHKLLSGCYKAANNLLRTATSGRYGSVETDFVLVARKMTASQQVA